MANTVSPVSLSELFFPERYNYKKFANSLTRLIQSVALGVIKALNNKTYRAFDANPGDGGCQNRALLIRNIVQIDLTSQCAAIEEAVRDIPKEATKDQLKDQSYFDRYLGQTSVSSEMGFLLLSYLLTALKKVSDTSDKGIISTKTDVALMEHLHLGQHI